MAIYGRLTPSGACAGLVLVLLTRSAIAGPPYVSDDPETTEYKHFEIYTFTSGMTARDGTVGQSGIDFNYGATPDLQLTATVPAGFDRPVGGGTSVGLSNIELAAKYRFLHQDSFGLDVSIFPRVFLPSGSNTVGDNRVSLLLPVWVQKDWSGGWSAFGGGGCTVSERRGSYGPFYPRCSRHSPPSSPRSASRTSTPISRLLYEPSWF